MDVNGFVTGRERGQRKRGDEELNLLSFNRYQFIEDVKSFP